MKKVILPLWVSISFQMPIFKAYAETPTPESIQKMNLSPEEQFKKANELSRILCHQNLNSSQTLRSQVERKEQEMSLLLDEIHNLRMGKTIATYAGPAVVFPSMAYATFRVNRLSQKTKALLIQNKDEILKKKILRPLDFQPVQKEFDQTFNPLMKLAVGNAIVVALSFASLDWMESLITKRLKELKELSESFGEDAVLCALAQSR